MVLKMSAGGDAGTSKGLKIIILEIALGIVLIVLGAIDASIATGSGIGVHILQELDKTGIAISPLDFLILTVVLVLVGIAVLTEELQKILRVR